MPLGQDSNRRSSARIIASTHVDLWELQQKELFRKDLHYRLRTHRITLPPLRDRKEDLFPLVEHFIRTAAESVHKSKPRVPTEIIQQLEQYHFPGNVRELQAMVFDAVAQSDSQMLPLKPFRDHITRSRQTESRQAADEAQPQGLPLRFSDPLPTIKEATRMLIEEAMLRSGNNQSTAAAMLGISQQALSKRLKNWDKEK